MPDFAQSLMPPDLTLPAFTPALEQRCQLILDSYQRLLGKPLLPDGEGSACQRLWHAPCVVVAHGTGADPVFFFGNRMALARFALDFAAFTQLPSRYSAEPLQRDERARLLERVSRDGYIDDYAGIRISSRGERFMIRQATVWNLLEADGTIQGQAATFSHWEALPALPPV